MNAGTDQVYRALADPTRRRILRFLAARDMTAGELAAKFEISGPSMSHHFNVLKGSGLIAGKRDGQQILYSLNTTAMQDLLGSLMDLLRKGEVDGESR